MAHKPYPTCHILLYLLLYVIPQAKNSFYVFKWLGMPNQKNILQAMKFTFPYMWTKLYLFEDTKSTPIHFCITWDCLCPTKAEVSCCNRLHGPQSRKYLHSWSKGFFESMIFNILLVLSKSLKICLGLDQGWLEKWRQALSHVNPDAPTTSNDTWIH